jgi:hypothetical protein
VLLLLLLHLLAQRALLLLVHLLAQRVLMQLLLPCYVAYLSQVH